MLKFITSVLGVLLLLLTAGFYFLNRIVDSSLPDYDKTYQTSKIKAPVQILRDEYAVPVIQTNNISDLYYSVGFLHAQDRLFQMDLFRKMSEGRLSEWFGDTTLVTDIFYRTLLLKSQAERIIQKLNPEEKLILWAYTNGVNDYVRSQNNERPVEYSFLGSDLFEEWTETNSVMIFLMLDWWLGFSEVDRQLNSNHQLVSSLFTKPNSYLLNIFQDIESRLIVVPKSRSESGKTLIYNELRGKPLLPAFWYPSNIQLNDTTTAFSVSLPGFPAFFNGKTHAAAWTVHYGSKTELTEHISDQKLNDRPEVIFVRGMENYNLLVKTNSDETAAVLNQVYSAGSNKTAVWITTDFEWKNELSAYHSLISGKNIRYPEQTVAVTGDNLFVSGNFQKTVNNEIIYFIGNDKLLGQNKSLSDSSDFKWLDFILNKKVFRNDELSLLADITDYNYAVTTKLLLVNRLAKFQGKEIDQAVKYLSVWRAEFNKQDIGSTIFIIWNYYFLNEADKAFGTNEIYNDSNNRNSVQRKTLEYIKNPDTKIDSLLSLSVIKTIVTLKLWFGDDPAEWRYDKVVQYQLNPINVGQNNDSFNREEQLYFSDGYRIVLDIISDTKKIAVNQSITHMKYFGELNSEKPLFMVSSGGVNGSARSPHFSDQLALMKKNKFIENAIKASVKHLTEIEPLK